MSFALLLAVGLGLLAVISLRYQIRNMYRLRSEMIPSDDRRYLRGQCWRRTVNSVLLLVIASMIAWAYASGGMARFEAIANAKSQEPPLELTEEDREFVKACTYYLIVCLIILFFVMLIALADWFAISLYGRQQLRRIQGEQSALLERDLVMHRQKKLNDRMKKL